MVRYIGNSDASYANSLAMLFAYQNAEISVELIDALTGSGLGAHWDVEERLLYFENWDHGIDDGIKQASSLLGYNIQHEQSPKRRGAPWAKLEQALEQSLVLAGPVDMGYLRYLPQRNDLAGVDHYVLLYGLDAERVYLHDPDGFPFVSLQREDWERAWRAASITFVEQGFHFWTTSVRENIPSEDELYQQAIACFKTNYRESIDYAEAHRLPYGSQAITAFLRDIKQRPLSEQLYEHLAYFTFQFASVRAFHLARFFDRKNLQLSHFKKEQSIWLGKSHVALIENDHEQLAVCLNKWGELEQRFMDELNV